MQDQRFIEYSFPIKEVSEQGAKEKNIRHGHISTLHIWWARRPLATSRATNYAALIPAPKDIDEYNRKRNFIVELSKWENSLNHQIIKKCTLEFPQKYGKEKIKIKQKNGMFEEEREVSKLIYDVEKWGKYVLEEAKREIGKFYTNDEDGSVPVGYIWVRTIPTIKSLKRLKSILEKKEKNFLKSGDL